MEYQLNGQEDRTWVGEVFFYLIGARFLRRQTVLTKGTSALFDFILGPYDLSLKSSQREGEMRAHLHQPPLPLPSLHDKYILATKQGLRNKLCQLRRSSGTQRV